MPANCVEEGRAVGLSVQELEDAERILQQIVAQQALAAALSPGCRDAKHLRTAIDEGKAVGLAVEELEHAERVLQQVVARQALAAALVPGSCDVENLRAIIDECKAAGLENEEVGPAEYVLDQKERFVLEEKGKAFAREKLAFAVACKQDCTEILRTALQQGAAAGLQESELVRVVLEDFRFRSD